MLLEALETGSLGEKKKKRDCNRETRDKEEKENRKGMKSDMIKKGEKVYPPVATSLLNVDPSAANAARNRAMARLNNFTKNMEVYKYFYYSHF